ncbi:hypothetical protein BCR32DRAFT_250517 [Anaeromyces robustus]|uniref:Uncharacterized protein n=1 Tax=Anaeromyces robustus TaxID=1754192 RepID=A0A1Y1VYY9_9FUNG|nr:hypothetical protein BCR32DRAFT_250517 [Anaeromyces robustus]|eukprot:ORX66236.1 hypothetical protein BCR32DRAFT_250517 [Anaeromyces robustus]
MGQCLGKQKNVKTYDSYKLDNRVASKDNTYQKKVEKKTQEETLDEKRRKAAEAAEKRMNKQSSKGVVNNGGKLSKNIEKQKSIGPGRSGDFYKGKNEDLDPSKWN